MPLSSLTIGLPLILLTMMFVLHNCQLRRCRWCFCIKRGYCRAVWWCNRAGLLGDGFHLHDGSDSAWLGDGLRLYD